MYNYMCLFGFSATAMASDGDDRTDSRLTWAVCGSLARWSGGDVCAEPAGLYLLRRSGIRESGAKWNRMIWVDGRDRKRKKI